MATAIFSNGAGSKLAAYAPIVRHAADDTARCAIVPIATS